MQKSSILFIFLLNVVLDSSANHLIGKYDEINIQVFSNVKLKQLQITAYRGMYTFKFDSNNVIFKASQFPLALSSSNDSLIITDSDLKKYFAKIIICKPVGVQNDLELKPLDPILYSKRFDDEIIINTKDNYIRVYNKLNFEKYVSNVIAAEVGTNANAEYYKTQAILSRTYALANLRKHELESFQLCDQVHCQVMHGNVKVNEQIRNAVKYTQGLVLISDAGEIAQTAFHSNCGGQTIDAADIWNVSKSYLKSIIDTFCLHENSAVWKKEISLDKWKKYLSNQFNLNETQINEFGLSFIQNERKKILNNQSNITLKQIRSDFNLRSTYFSIEIVDTLLVFKGRGFGHGVGLCQQGAMRMATKNYTFKQILNTYYNKLNIVHMNYLSFFME